MEEQHLVQEGVGLGREGDVEDYGKAKRKMREEGLDDFLILAPR